MYTTVTICVPGTSTCQTIDHIQIDTASYGLRVLSEVLQPAVANALAVVKESTSKQVLAECASFADGYSWGPIKMADVQIAGETAAGIEIQVIGDPSYTNVPSGCSNQGGAAENTVAAFGANGVLGVGPFVDDCGSGCASGSAPPDGWYYICASSPCTATFVSESQQVSNPVNFFQVDNNGVIIHFAAIPDAGQATASGSLIFGIDTESNNALPQSGIAVLHGNSADGSFTTKYGTSTLTGSYIDSGSNGYFFADTFLTVCATSQGFYCPASTQVLSAQNIGQNAGESSTVSFKVANADSLFNSPNAAFDDVGGPLGSSQQAVSGGVFDWGAPFFYGRSVYTAIAGAKTATSIGQGPYFAY
jgi:hypothetical protein